MSADGRCCHDLGVLVRVEATSAGSPRRPFHSVWAPCNKRSFLAQCIQLSHSTSLETRGDLVPAASQVIQPAARVLAAARVNRADESIPRSPLTARSSTESDTAAPSTAASSRPRDACVAFLRQRNHVPSAAEACELARVEMRPNATVDTAPRLTPGPSTLAECTAVCSKRPFLAQCRAGVGRKRPFVAP
jgi:hypothetical protein